jgi:flagellar basal-body rod modification protein FlgD
MTTSVQSAGTAQSVVQPTKTDRDKASVDYDSFLKLLVAQMKNQDPTSPNDSNEYLAQLAAFSNVEQSIKTNERLDALIAQGSMAQAGGLVGLSYSDSRQAGRVEAVILADDGMQLRLDNGAMVRPGAGSVFTR